MKIIIYGLWIILLGGCALQTTPQQMSQPEQTVVKSSPNDHLVYEQTVPAASQTINGMIRGVIAQQEYQQEANVWRYAVKAIDVANDKLDVATFIHTKSIHDVGDLVYVIIKEGRLQEIYLIKKQYQKTDVVPLHVEKAPKVVQKKVAKRTKARKTPWIDVPKEEKILLD